AKGSSDTPAASGTLAVLPQIIPTSTIPSNGDVNPYGVAFVPTGFPQTGTIQAGDILVSNFNNSGNLQGTGTTIVRRTQNGQASLFFQGTGLGLTTALGVLKKGVVLVGSVPTTDGTAATLKQGALLVLSDTGQLVATLTDSTTLDSPWDLTILDKGDKATVYVSNVISGTVSRLDIKIKKGNITVLTKTQIGSGYLTAPNAAALVVGPTGLALDSANDILYVASTGDNAIYAIDHASTAASSSGKGTLIYSDNTHLHGPLGLVLAANGDLITSNGDAINADPTQPSEIVEFTTTGAFVTQFQLDPNQGGAFGIALESIGNGFAQFAAVDDVPNTLLTWIVRTN
ncbi:MAG TPA: hypothetical protein VLZ81_09240, partial [Blastocatellia bacterium]|nr:hypothetical protein [Blastocatellia bacterium]